MICMPPLVETFERIIHTANLRDTILQTYCCFELSSISTLSLHIQISTIAIGHVVRPSIKPKKMITLTSNSYRCMQWQKDTPGQYFSYRTAYIPPYLMLFFFLKNASNILFRKKRKNPVLQKTALWAHLLVLGTPRSELQFTGENGQTKQAVHDCCIMQIYYPRTPAVKSLLFTIPASIAAFLLQNKLRCYKKKKKKWHPTVRFSPF